jgi:hypothetical protein
MHVRPLLSKFCRCCRAAASITAEGGVAASGVRRFPVSYGHAYKVHVSRLLYPATRSTTPRIGIDTRVVPSCHTLVVLPLSSVLPPPPTPPSSLLPTQPLLQPPPPRSLRLLQPLHALRLPRRRLIRHTISPKLHNQRVQSSKTSSSIISLFPRIISLNNQRVRLGSVIARREERLAQDWREEGEDGRRGYAEGGF